MFGPFQVYTDCKDMNMDVSLASCPGKGVTLSAIECDPFGVLHIFISPVLSCRFPDQSNEVLWKSRLREANFF